jgi:P-type E1-E2 ATPase
VDSAEVLQLAAVAERPSEHPLAKAVLREARRSNLPLSEPDAFEYLLGKGVRSWWNGEEILVGNVALLGGIEGLEAQLRTLPEAGSDLLVAYRGRLVGALKIDDVLRPDAVGAVARIRSLGIDTILMTGDRSQFAQEIARNLGVREFAAELLLQEKPDQVRSLIGSGRRVAMVGDGVNDAPALAESTVGIAMGSRTDLSRHSAGVLLLGDDLGDCVDLLHTAQRCRRIIFFNLVGTLIVDAFGLMLAALGVLTPLTAALVHVCSDMVFLLNSARLVPESTRKSTRRVDAGP